MLRHKPWEMRNPVTLKGLCPMHGISRTYERKTWRLS